MIHLIHQSKVMIGEHSPRTSPGATAGCASVQVWWSLSCLPSWRCASWVDSSTAATTRAWPAAPSASAASLTMLACGRPVCGTSPTTTSTALARRAIAHLELPLRRIGAGDEESLLQLARLRNHIRNAEPIGKLGTCRCTGHHSVATRGLQHVQNEAHLFMTASVMKPDPMSHLFLSVLTRCPEGAGSQCRMWSW